MQTLYAVLMHCLSIQENVGYETDHMNLKRQLVGTQPFDMPAAHGERTLHYLGECVKNRSC